MQRIALGSSWYGLGVSLTFYSGRGGADLWFQQGGVSRAFVVIDKEQAARLSVNAMTQIVEGS